MAFRDGNRSSVLGDNEEAVWSWISRWKGNHLLRRCYKHLNTNSSPASWRVGSSHTHTSLARHLYYQEWPNSASNYCKQVHYYKYQPVSLLTLTQTTEYRTHNVNSVELSWLLARHPRLAGGTNTTAWTTIISKYYKMYFTNTLPIHI